MSGMHDQGCRAECIKARTDGAGDLLPQLRSDLHHLHASLRVSVAQAPGVGCAGCAFAVCTRGLGADT
eukprot:3613360-Rhodomonas_salina.5